MKLSALKQKIDKILAENPAAADYPVILPSDDEGNGYREAYYMGICKYFDMENMELHNDEDIEHTGNYDQDSIDTFVPVFCF